MRGSEKKIIHVRDTGSRFFEEAYFVLKRGIGEGNAPPSENDMLQEASRIIAENTTNYPASVHRKKKHESLRAFLAGIGAGIVLIGSGVWILFL